MSRVCFELRISALKSTPLVGRAFEVVNSLDVGLVFAQ